MEDSSNSNGPAGNRRPARGKKTRVFGVFEDGKTWICDDLTPHLVDPTTVIKNQSVTQIKWGDGGIYKMTVALVAGK